MKVLHCDRRGGNRRGQTKKGAPAGAPLFVGFSDRAGRSALSYSAAAGAASAPRTELMSIDTPGPMVELSDTFFM